MKRRVEIEKLIRWAYADELPKDGATSFLRPDGFGFGWGSTAKYAKYGADVQEPDRVNRFGVTPDQAATSGPHPDAVAIHMAILELDRLDFDLPADWYPLSDICPIDGDLGTSGLAATARGLRRIVGEGRDGAKSFGRAVSEFIRIRAILGPPDWRAEKPISKKVSYSDGRPKWFYRETISTEGGSYEVETENGYDRKRRIGKPGAYQKHFLDPDPVEAVIARAEYQIWHSALSAVVEDVAGRLDDYEPLPIALPAWPWEEKDRPAPRILVDMNPQPIIVKAPRPIAGPPLRRGIDRKAEKAGAN